MQTPYIIDLSFLDALSAEAESHARKRKNYNFHAADGDPAHRLLNAMALGTYIVPHRHLAVDKDESIFIVRGKVGAVFFNEAGEVTAKSVLSPQGPGFGINIPAGTFHTLVTLEAGSVFFEAKAGPYAPLTPEERAPWAPAEGEPASLTYLKELTALFN